MITTLKLGGKKISFHGLSMNCKFFQESCYVEGSRDLDEKNLLEKWYKKTFRTIILSCFFYASFWLLKKNSLKYRKVS
jgi:hypothetical protein